MVVPVVDSEEITGSGSDSLGNSLTISGDTAFDEYFGLVIANPLAPNFGSAVETTTTGNQSAVISGSPVGMTIWEATSTGTGLAVGDQWTRGAIVATQNPATGGTPLFATLVAGQKYLLEVFGTLIHDGPGDELAQYNLTIAATVVPVPAAVWLFGSAMLGFLGLRRKAKLGAVAA